MINIQSIASFASIVVMAFTAIALILNSNNVKLQRKSLQANLFNNISSRIRELEDQWDPVNMTNEQKYEWYIRLLNALEYFCFFANRDDLSAEMKIFFKSGIEEYMKRLEKPKYIELLSRLKRRPKEQYCELREYSKRENNRDIPF